MDIFQDSLCQVIIVLAVNMIGKFPSEAQIDLANRRSADAPLLHEESFETCFGWEPVSQLSVLARLIVEGYYGSCGVDNSVSQPALLRSVAL